MYIPKYSLLSPYNVTYIRVLRLTDNQFIYSSLRRANSPVPTFTELLIVLCVGLKPNGLFHIQFEMLVVSLV